MIKQYLVFMEPEDAKCYDLEQSLTYKASCLLKNWKEYANPQKALTLHYQYDKIEAYEMQCKLWRLF